MPSRTFTFCSKPDRLPRPCRRYASSTSAILLMIAILHRQIISTKAEWRADPSRRHLPPIQSIAWPDPRPLPYRGGTVQIRTDASVWAARRQVVQLHPWQPVRIVRNQRRAHYYTLEDYHLLLNGPNPPNVLPPVRVIDLQLDRA